ncbi:MAG: hypothetical protein ACK55Z_20760 [bacterium]|jgi:hypothetical protein
MNPVIEAWIVIEKLAALVATSGVDEKTKELANEQIQNMLRDVVAPSLSKLSASSVGLIVK